MQTLTKQQNTIIDAVCKFTNITREQIFEKTRIREIAEARQIIYYLFNVKNNMSLTNSGKIFKQGHATVLHAINKIKALIKFNKEIRNLVSLISEYVDQIFNGIARKTELFIEMMNKTTMCDQEKKIRLEQFKNAI